MDIWRSRCVGIVVEPLARALTQQPSSLTCYPVDIISACHAEPLTTLRKRAFILLFFAISCGIAAAVLPRLLLNPLATLLASSLGWLAVAPPAFEPALTSTPPSIESASHHCPTQPAPAAGQKPQKNSPARPSGGILVRQDVVRSAVQRGIRPTASPVAATHDHPAGLIVYGWGAAGAGLADGDIITIVGGRQPRSVDDVVIAVAGAYKSPVKAVSGQIWRKGKTLSVTVELPTDNPRSTTRPSASTSSQPLTASPSIRKREVRTFSMPRLVRPSCAQCQRPDNTPP